MGAHFLLSWLYETYAPLVDHFMYDAVAKVCMLELVGCIILDDKLHVYIDATHISLFSDLISYSWARVCVALLILYHALGEVTTF